MDQEHVRPVVVSSFAIAPTPGPTMVRQRTGRKARAPYRERQAAFVAGTGKNPARNLLGPARSFAHDAIATGPLGGASAALVAGGMALA